MVRVRIEPGAGACACRGSSSPARRRPLEPRGAVTPPATFAPGIHGVDRRVAGIEELADIRRRRRRAQPARLVRLVPHRATGSPSCSGSRPCAAKPANAAAPGAKFGVLPPFAQRGEPTSPTTAGMPRSCRPFRTQIAVLPVLLAAHRLDPVPVEVEAHDVDPEALEPVEPLVERAGAVDEPGVVLDPEAHAVATPAAAGAARPIRAHKVRAARRKRIEAGSRATSLPTHQDPVNDARRRRFRAFTSGT